MNTNNNHISTINMTYSVAFLAAEGFQLKHDFIIKELTLMYTNNEFYHARYCLPDNNCVLDAQDRKTIKFTETYLCQLDFDDGEVPYNILMGQIRKLEKHTIFCYGVQLKNKIQLYIPNTNVINIQDFGFKLPKTLLTADCGRNHNPRYCSLAKAYAIKSHVRNNQAIFGNTFF